MTTAPADADYENLGRTELQALAKERGIPANMASGEIAHALREYDQASRPMAVATTTEDIAPGEDLEATQKFVGPEQPAFRHDANQRKPEPSDPSITFVDRADLLRMAKGEIVDIHGTRLAAGRNFPPYYQLQR